MSPNACAELSDRLPDWVAGRLAPEEGERVAVHVRSCAECAAQAALLRGLFEGRPPAPPGLAERIAGGLGSGEIAGATRRPRRVWPVWATSAAAVLVLAVGSLLFGGDDRTGEPDRLGQVAVDDAGVWIADDGVVAGAPLLDELSDETLAALLEEMER